MPDIFDGPGRESCPDVKTLLTFVEGRFDEDAATEISRHIVDCERCYQLIAETARAMSSPGPPPDPAPRQALLPALLTAGVIAVALALLLFLLLPGVR